MRRWFTLLVGLWAGLCAAPLAAAPPSSEIVVVLDNSGSMVTSWELNGDTVQASDPERSAVLGALVMEGLARGSADQVTVLGFGETKGAPPTLARDQGSIRGMAYVGGTYFQGPLREARKILERSPRSQKLVLILSDGIPNDLDDPSEGIALLGLGDMPEVETLVVGLYGSDAVRERGSLFLRPLARRPEGFVTLDSQGAKRGQQVVEVFTRGFAQTLGAKPEVGTLHAGETRTFAVPRYVTEVMVMTASAAPGPAYTARLLREAGAEVTPRARGDNGCDIRLSNAPDLCAEPRRHYQVYRAAHDPQTATTWSLSLPSATGAVEYGIILRYDLEVAVRAAPLVQLGEALTLEANLLFQGEVFNDPEFFERDGFTVEAEIGEERVALSPGSGGVFTGTWVPSEPTDGEPARITARFKNAWMEKTGVRPVTVEGRLDFHLSPQPSPLELGGWRGERGETTRCATLDLSASLNAERVPIVCDPQGVPEGVTVTCSPVAGSEAALPSRRGQPLQWEVCVTAKGCCNQIPASPASVRIAGRHPLYAAEQAEIPLHFAVEEAGFWRCWWIELLIGGVSAFLLWIAVGLLRPHSFDPSATVRIAGSEAGLRRTSALPLVEQPGGTRGFYRDARICIDGDGNPVRKPTQAVLVLQAQASGTHRFTRVSGLEKKNPRNNRWAPVPTEELEAGYHPGVLYRVGGGLYLKFS